MFKILLSSLAIVWAGVVSTTAYATEHKGVSPKMALCFTNSARTYDVPRSLLMAVGRTESNFDPEAISHALAVGIMQIQWPQTAKHLGVERLDKLFDPCVSIQLGAKYLRELYDRYGAWDYVLGAYNYGPGRITSGQSMPQGALRYVAKVRSYQPRYQEEVSPSAAIYIISKAANLPEAKAVVAWLEEHVDTLEFDIQSNEVGHQVVATVRDRSTIDQVRGQLQQLAQR